MAAMHTLTRTKSHSRREQQTSSKHLTPNRSRASAAQQLPGTQIDPLLILTELLAESCLSAAQYVPADVQRISRTEDLSPALERIAEQVHAIRHAWLAWTNKQRLWFVTAKIIFEGGDDHGKASLRLSFYESDGRIAASGVWTLDRESSWKLSGI